MRPSEQEIPLPQPGTISQICFATHDIEAAAQRWTRTAGAGPFFYIDLPECLHRQYRGNPAEDQFTAAMGFMGLTLVEFLQPANDQPSIIREILDRHGEGAVHHVYPEIRPLDAAGFDTACQRYRALGLVEALSFTIPGMGRNSFFDATATLGHFIEVLEFSPLAYEMTVGPLYRAHLLEQRAGPVRHLGSM